MASLFSSLFKGRNTDAQVTTSPAQSQSQVPNLYVNLNIAGVSVKIGNISKEIQAKLRSFNGKFQPTSEFLEQNGYYWLVLALYLQDRPSIFDLINVLQFLSEKKMSEKDGQLPDIIKKCIYEVYLHQYVPKDIFNQFLQIIGTFNGGTLIETPDVTDILKYIQAFNYSVTINVAHKGVLAEREIDSVITCCNTIKYYDILEPDSNGIQASWEARILSLYFGLQYILNARRLSRVHDIRIAQTIWAYLHAYETDNALKHSVDFKRSFDSITADAKYDKYDEIKRVKAALAEAEEARLKAAKDAADRLLFFTNNHIPVLYKLIKEKKDVLAEGHLNDVKKHFDALTEENKKTAQRDYEDALAKYSQFKESQAKEKERQRLEQQRKEEEQEQQERQRKAEEQQERQRQAQEQQRQAQEQQERQRQAQEQQEQQRQAQEQQEQQRQAQEQQERQRQAQEQQEQQRQAQEQQEQQRQAQEQQERQRQAQEQQERQRQAQERQERQRKAEEEEQQKRKAEEERQTIDNFKSTVGDLTQLLQTSRSGVNVRTAKEVVDKLYTTTLSDEQKAQVQPLYDEVTNEYKNSIHGQIDSFIEKSKAFIDSQGMDDAQANQLFTEITTLYKAIPDSEKNLYAPKYIKVKTKYDQINSASPAQATPSQNNPSNFLRQVWTLNSAITNFSPNTELEQAKSSLERQYNALGDAEKLKMQDSYKAAIANYENHADVMAFNQQVDLLNRLIPMDGYSNAVGAKKNVMDLFEKLPENQKSRVREMYNAVIKKYMASNHASKELTDKISMLTSSTGMPAQDAGALYNDITNLFKALPQKTAADPKIKTMYEQATVKYKQYLSTAAAAAATPAAAAATPAAAAATPAAAAATPAAPVALIDMLGLEQEIAQIRQSAPDIGDPNVYDTLSCIQKYALLIHLLENTNADDTARIESLRRAIEVCFDEHGSCFPDTSTTLADNTKKELKTRLITAISKFSDLPVEVLTAIDENKHMSTFVELEKLVRNLIPSESESETEKRTYENVTAKLVEYCSTDLLKTYVWLLLQTRGTPAIYPEDEESMYNFMKNFEQKSQICQKFKGASYNQLVTNVLDKIEPLLKTDFWNYIRNNRSKYGSVRMGKLGGILPSLDFYKSQVDALDGKEHITQFLEFWESKLSNIEDKCTLYDEVLDTTKNQETTTLFSSLSCIGKLLFYYLRVTDTDFTWFARINDSLDGITNCSTMPMFLSGNILDFAIFVFADFANKLQSLPIEKRRQYINDIASYSSQLGYIHSELVETIQTNTLNVTAGDYKLLGYNISENDNLPMTFRRFMSAVQRSMNYVTNVDDPSSTTVDADKKKSSLAALELLDLTISDPSKVGCSQLFWNVFITSANAIEVLTEEKMIEFLEAWKMVRDSILTLCKDTFPNYPNLWNIVSNKSHIVFDDLLRQILKADNGALHAVWTKKVNDWISRVNMTALDLDWLPIKKHRLMDAVNFINIHYPETGTFKSAYLTKGYLPDQIIGDTEYEDMIDTLIKNKFSDKVTVDWLMALWNLYGTSLSNMPMKQRRDLITRKLASTNDNKQKDNLNASKFGFRLCHILEHFYYKTHTECKPAPDDKTRLVPPLEPVGYLWSYSRQYTIGAYNTTDADAHAAFVRAVLGNNFNLMFVPEQFKMTRKEYRELQQIPNENSSSTGYSITPVIGKYLNQLFSTYQQNSTFTYDVYQAMITEVDRDISTRTKAGSLDASLYIAARKCIMDAILYHLGREPSAIVTSEQMLEIQKHVLEQVQKGGAASVELIQRIAELWKNTSSSTTSTPLSTTSAPLTPSTASMSPFPRMTEMLTKYVNENNPYAARVMVETIDHTYNGLNETQKTRVQQEYKQAKDLFANFEKLVTPATAQPVQAKSSSWSWFSNFISPSTRAATPAQPTLGQPAQTAPPAAPMAPAQPTLGQTAPMAPAQPTLGQTAQTAPPAAPMAAAQTAQTSWWTTLLGKLSNWVATSSDDGGASSPATVQRSANVNITGIVSQGNGLSGDTDEGGWVAKRAKVAGEWIKGAGIATWEFLKEHWLVILGIALAIIAMIVIVYLFAYVPWGEHESDLGMHVSTTSRALHENILPDLSRGTLCFWTYVNSWTIDSPKYLFSKGGRFQIYLEQENSNLCVKVPLRPGIIEKMTVAADGDKDEDEEEEEKEKEETSTSTIIKISNFPLMRWNHLAFTFSRTKVVDIWLNGMLVISRELPRLDTLGKNYRSSLYPTRSTFDARITRLVYFREPVNSTTMQQLVKKGPVVKSLLDRLAGV
jgi:hypothetical protein